MLGDDGTLSLLDDATDARNASLSEHLVVDIHRTAGGELWALTSNLNMHGVDVWAFVGEEWKVRAVIGDVKNPPVALGDVAGDPLVRTFDTASRASKINMRGQAFAQRR